MPIKIMKLFCTFHRTMTTDTYTLCEICICRYGEVRLYFVWINKCRLILKQASLSVCVVYMFVCIWAWCSIIWLASNIVNYVSIFMFCALSHLRWAYNRISNYIIIERSGCYVLASLTFFFLLLRIRSSILQSNEAVSYCEIAM